MNISSYHLVSHSISGVYSLAYINEYPNAVKSFIGIDSSLPDQGGAEDNQGETIKLLSQSGIYRLLADADPAFLNGPKLSEKDAEQFKYISLKNIGNNATMNEGEEMQKNFDKTAKLTYPVQLPVLYFLASESVEPDEKWVPLHENAIKNNHKSEIKILEGGHYLHHTQSKKMVETITSFFKK